MYYSNTKAVLEDIADYLKDKYAESFAMDKEGADMHYATYDSENYSFKVSMSFIQARVKEDFDTPIQQRLESVLERQDIEMGKKYMLSCKSVDRSLPEGIPLEYST